MTSTVIVGGARTPVGRFLGGLSGLSASTLGGIAIRAALDRARMRGQDLDAVYMGQVLTAGAGQLPARQAAVAGGIPMTVPATTIGKVCLSGLQTVILADQAIRAGDATRVLAGGQESMSQAPHLLTGSRRGHRYGPVTMLDHMAVDGLQDAFTGEAMGELTDRGEEQHPIDRIRQDAWALRSHQRAASGWDAGLLENEVVPVDTPTGLITRDEGIRAVATMERLTGLRAAFRPGGAITAGNASPISDGACALALMSRAAAERDGVAWIAEIGASGQVAGPGSGLQLQPANAIRAACRREGIGVEDLDLIEVNEAFAAVVLASIDDLGIDPDRVNVNGGAIAIGHPIGMSGARLVLHAALELQRRGGGVAAVALCGGGGQGDAVILRVPPLA